MKKFAVFLMIMATCGGTYGTGLDLQKQQIIAQSDKTRLNVTTPPTLPKAKPTHTIDKRKYVSRDTEPFSDVVGLKYQGGENWCSGTLTADGIVVTAKHCIFDGYSNSYKPSDSIIINSRNGDTGVRTWRASGHDVYPNGNYDDTYDWALLAPRADIKSNILVSKLTNGTGDVVLVGYGALKILSDQEIRKIRTEYAKWLNRNAGTNVAGNAADLNERSSFGSQFVSDIKADKINGIPSDTFNDTNKLKASYCRATIGKANSNEIGCQMWGGNSGGSVFLKRDNKWYLFGAHVSGHLNITNNRNTYAQGARVVPINMFIESYKKLVNELKGKK